MSCVIAPLALPFCGWLAMVNVVVRVPERAWAVLAAVLSLVLGGVGVLLAAAGWPLDELSSFLGITVVVVLLAALLRAQRAREAALVRERVAASREEQAQQRLHLARDMHDLVGHGLSAIAVQSSTARMALQAGQVDTALTAVSAVEAGSRETMAGVRALLALLREEEPQASRVPAPGLDDLPVLIKELHAVADIDLQVQEGLELAPSVGLCVYRVVQESLTNALKHSPGGRVSVRVMDVEGILVVEVADDGPRVAPFVGYGVGRTVATQGSGLGLRGMRERVGAQGGTLSAANREGGGWLVRATLPHPATPKPVLDPSGPASTNGVGA
jgi:signal transduction histidine kinase